LFSMPLRDAANCVAAVKVVVQVVSSNTTTWGRLNAAALKITEDEYSRIDALIDSKFFKVYSIIYSTYTLLVVLLL
jgi:hypothetical protein